MHNYIKPISITLLAASINAQADTLSQSVLAIQQYASSGNYESTTVSCCKQEQSNETVISNRQIIDPSPVKSSEDHLRWESMSKTLGDMNGVIAKPPNRKQGKSYDITDELSALDKLIQTRKKSGNVQ